MYPRADGPQAYWRRVDSGGAGTGDGAVDGLYRKVCASLQLSIVNSAARIAGRLRLKRGPGRTKHFS